MDYFIYLFIIYGISAEETRVDLNSSQPDVDVHVHYMY